jgi:hypothetical protein
MVTGNGDEKPIASRHPFPSLLTVTSFRHFFSSLFSSFRLDPSSLLYQCARIFARAMIFAYLATSRPKNTPGSSGVK